MWQQVRDLLPADLDGCSALEIGCNAGFFAIELARRGARVTATETSPHFLNQALWTTAQHGVTARIDFYRCSPYDLARWRGHYDVVLLLNQLHCLRYPLLALDLAAQLTRRCLVLQIPSQPGESSGGSEPAAPTSQPLTSGLPLGPGQVEAMLRSASFEIVAQPSAGLYLCQPTKRNRVDARWVESEFESATGARPPGLNRYHDGHVGAADSEKRPTVSIMRG
jgi:tRNA (mo5U34)-methyltransferase